MNVLLNVAALPFVMAGFKSAVQLAVTVLFDT